MKEMIVILIRIVLVVEMMMVVVVIKLQIFVVYVMVQVPKFNVGTMFGYVQLKIVNLNQYQDV